MIKFGTRAVALPKSVKTANTSRRYGHRGTSFSVAFVIMPSVPSEPMTSWSRQKPVEHFFKGAPRLAILPFGRTTSIAYT